MFFVEKDPEKTGYILVGLAIKDWQSEIWFQLAYVLVWLSISRVLVRRDIYSILFYLGLIFNECTTAQLNAIYVSRWDLGIIAHYLTCNLCTILQSSQRKFIERYFGCCVCMAAILLMFPTNPLIIKSQLLPGTVVGCATGAIWYMTLSWIDSWPIWERLFSRHHGWNVFLIRHMRKIENKALFEYFLTQEQNDRRHNVIRQQAQNEVAPIPIPRVHAIDFESIDENMANRMEQF